MAKHDDVRRKLPVTLVGGFVGAGKTAAIKQMLAEREGQKVAVLTRLMEDRESEGSNRGSAMLSPLAAKVVRCSEASLEHLTVDDWARHLSRLCADASVDSLIVELAGADAPAVVASLFSTEHEQAAGLSEYAELRAVVVVVDAVSFFDDYSGFERVGARAPVLGAPGQRYVARVLADQVESADLLVLNKVDAASRPERAVLQAMLREMNPSAQLAEHSFDGRGEPRRIEHAGDLQVSLRAQAGCVVSSFVYEARRPFHPGRVRALFEREWQGVLRSRGVFWLATRMSEVGSWSQAGGVWEIARAGYWWATLPKQMWSTSPVLRAAVQERWREPFGDRRQELSFIGLDLDEPGLRASFDECLLTDAELSGGPERWARLTDPFARWSDVMGWGRSGGAAHMWH